MGRRWVVGNYLGNGFSGRAAEKLGGESRTRWVAARHESGQLYHARRGAPFVAGRFRESGWTVVRFFTQGARGVVIPGHWTGHRYEDSGSVRHHGFRTAPVGFVLHRS
jgi:hypothetical protein